MRARPLLPYLRRRRRQRAQLAICRQLVTMMGGDIGVASKLGKGSTFFFTAVFGVAAGTQSVPVKLPSAGMRDLRILLVDVSADSCQIFKDLLQGLGDQTSATRDVAGMRVSVAVNGEQAVELIRSERFDAVLMDVQMPVMDGCQATTLVRQDPSLATLPIIAMTAHVMARDRDKCLAVGMNDHLSKAFDSRELFAVLTRDRTQPVAKCRAGRTLQGR